MRLPPIELDDRRFQELVSESRTRINGLCPQWTEHNVSDPGIALIELFAWMTEMVTYRLNRVPDKIHVEMLDLLGVRLRPPEPARTDLRFLLTASPSEPFTIGDTDTQVGTERTANDESIVFEVAEPRLIKPLRPAAYVLTRGEEISVVQVDDGVVRPVGPNRPMFAERPHHGDAFALGFDEPIGRLILRVEADVEPARGAGINPSKPPLQWEVGTGEDQWEPATVLEDTTGGFNLDSGHVLVELPPESVRLPLGGQRMHWLRCRLVEPEEVDGGRYQRPPSVLEMTARPMGATLPARHAAHVDNEVLGESDGTPAQTFTVLRPPMLPPSDDEGLEVRDPGGATWSRWERVDSFAGRRADEQVYVVDAATGTIELGPAVRLKDGSWRQYGAIPVSGAQLRLSRYRHGGGLVGNVAAGTLNVLKEGPAGIASVTNPLAARGGTDMESLDNVRVRGAMELRARDRAVTKEDFEHLAMQASSGCARAVCVAPEEGTAVLVRVLPSLHPTDRRLGFAELQPPRELLEIVANDLDARRMLGMTVNVAPVRLHGVSVVVELQTEPLADLVRIRTEVERELYRYLNPLCGGVAGGMGPGWEFGRTLNQGELYGVVHAVEGVEYVRLLRIYETNLRSGKQAPEPAGSHVVLEPDEVVASGKHTVRATMRGT